MRERIVAEGRDSRDPGLPNHVVLFRALDPLSTGPTVGLDDALRAVLSCIATSVGLASTFLLGLEVGASLTGHPPGTVMTRIIEGVRDLFHGDINRKHKKKKRK